jgi:hypothetical protein
LLKALAILELLHESTSKALTLAPTLPTFFVMSLLERVVSPVSMALTGLVFLKNKELLSD